MVKWYHYKLKGQDAEHVQYANDVAAVSSLVSEHGDDLIFVHRVEDRERLWWQIGYVARLFEVYSVPTEGQGDFVYRRFLDPVEAIEYAQGNHPEAPRYEGCGGGGARVRVIQ